MTEISISKPDDWHLHVRDGKAMAAVVPLSAAQFARAIIMPNLKPPVTTVEAALQYRQRIMAALPQESRFEPLMTLYLTDNTPADEILKAKQNPHVYAVKYYPAGATTNSDSGVTHISNAYDTLAAMEEHDLPLLLHGEVTDPGVDVFDREKVFIDTVLNDIQRRFPRLRIVLEHITTKNAVDFVSSCDANVAATITPQHILCNRNALFKGGINPHFYCLPILKRERHREAVLAAATSGNAKFFLGTDSAPHPQNAKESACGCAGIFSAHAAVELYATAFEQAGALDKLEAFASYNGADFYQLPRNTETVTLTMEDWEIPNVLPLGEDKVVPFFAGQTISWKLK
ncbi:dihydroorotase [Kaarinaea lacus]